MRSTAFKQLFEIYIKVDLITTIFNLLTIKEQLIYFNINFEQLFKCCTTHVITNNSSINCNHYPKEINIGMNIDMNVNVNISKENLFLAYKILSKIEQYLINNNDDERFLYDLTNLFYEIISHT